ncbi:MAG TPA: STN domain-containing protein [Armatimonadota bacterium]|nr:STN domain-containing protein [Armatimonadota bacterium]
MALHLDRGTVDIEAHDMDLRQVLDELFMLIGVKYDLPPEVQGRVTVDLHNATYEQALDMILGSQFTYSIGPHEIIYVHKGGTTWRPGNEKVA